ncbi:hypothetical protein ACFWY5_54200 [Nonomuraea sp. NPDC059007]|uniref:hypothetical protein n=1 Tax=Nonomuraea sp. NPDC059007 TaxID=3346692 RepID=UPI0036A00D6E
MTPMIRRISRWIAACEPTGEETTGRRVEDACAGAQRPDALQVQDLQGGISDCTGSMLVW